MSLCLSLPPFPLHWFFQGNSDHTSHCELTSSSHTDSTPHSQHGHPGRPDEAHTHTQNSGRTANTSTTEYQSLDQPRPGGNYEQNDTVYPVTDDGQSSSSGHLTDSVNITTIHVWPTIQRLQSIIITATLCFNKKQQSSKMSTVIGLTPRSCVPWAHILCVEFT